MEEPLLVKESKGDESVTPYSYAGVFGLLSFSWMGPLIALGNKKALDLEDVPQLYKDDSVVGAFASLKTGIESDGGSVKEITLFKLVKALFFTAWKEILLTAFLAMTYTAASYVGPYLIDAFVQCLSGKSEYKNQGYVLAVVFLAGKIVERVAQRQWFFKLQQIGIRMRASVVAMIYNKGLTLSCMSKQGQTSGEIINIMTVDAQRIADFSWYLHDPWLVILQVGLALFILYRNLGIAAVATLVATVVVMLLNFPLGRLQEGYQEKLMKSKDERMKATSEILRNMRILKLQAWEMKFLSKIIELRKTESGWLKRYGYASALISFFFWGAPTFVSVATFGTCILLRIPLSSGKILSALATFRVLQAPIYNLPDTVSMLVQMKVSLDRIVSFLRLDDLQDDVVNNLLPSGDSDTAIEIVNGTFSWDSSLPNPTLRDINLKVLSGMKVAVCGTVGSGKSSLLSCILGEVPRTSGTVELCGTKAYVAQSPWIQSGTIRENVLFGKEMNEDKYDKVLEACALKKDLELFSFGDRTGIGERGINLSGGQKQRIQIARALYQDADIYLFDDPFSAVDAHTGSHLFKEVLLGHLGSKTVVYVTHQVEFLPVADIILVMKDGRITQAGKYSDILNSGSDFMELVCAHKAGLSAISKASESENETVSKGNGDATMSNGIEPNLQNGKGDETDGGKTQGQLVQEEEREKGRVGFTVYWQYIVTAYGGALAPLTVLAHVMFQVFQIGSNYWMAWATPVSEDEEPPVPPMTLIAVYVILAVACSLCILVRTTLLAAIAYKTATLLFNKMHLCIFRAPMSFFDSTPSGRILNRASTDQSAVDQQIPYQLGTVAFAIIQLLGIVAVMSQVAWQVFIVCVPVIAISIWYQQYYIPAARELSRLVGVCKAPLIQHFAETISGATTIRSFDQQPRFQHTSLKLTDAYSRPHEPPLVIEETRPDVSWPSLGEVDIDGLQVRYAPHLPLVLRGLSCTFEGGKKTGIVGRTGSGKSTLIQTLFRVVDPTAGKITIDGIDIASIGLHDLRSRLSIIPQDPTMFEGTVRNNLDPLEEYSDEQIWEALDKCQLGEEVRKKEKKLDSSVSENGENWSMGQRQLVCLGRVVLKKSKVLVLDEATASVDTATDNLIQHTLRQHFSDSTVITIAHRITSVLDSDMVLLLSHGLIEEYDTPARLLENKSSSFAQLVAEYSERSKEQY
ncbi:ABC transporter C family member 3 [Linum grandiflorum]